MSRLLVAQRALTVPGWAKNVLWRNARALPSLDLRFADNKSLVDAVTGASLITFTRASSGTYVDSAGLLQTAVTNLQRYSEDFTQGLTPNNATLTANQGTAPNGTLTADQYLETTANGLHSQEIVDHTFIAGVTHTFSCYAKSIGGRNFGPGFPTLFGSARFGFFDLSGSGSYSTNAGVTASIQAVGDGWYRCSITSTCVTGGGARVGVFIASGTSISYVGDTAKGLLIWGAQLEQSATVGEYIPTTSAINSAPRFDHNPTTGESLGLLVEEQRTNSVTNNTMVGAVAGTPGTLPTSWGTFVSPTGLTRTIVGSGTVNGINYIDVRFNGTPSSTGEITLYLSPATTTTLAQAWAATAWLSIAGGSTSNIGGISLRNFELNSGVYVREISTNYVSSISSDFVRRQNITSSFGASANQIQLILTLFATAGGTPIDITLRIGLPQLELGAFATSVIPTTTAAATRSADVASIGSSAFTSFYNQSEGTVFADVNSAPVNTIVQLAVDITDAGGSDRMFIRRTGSGSLGVAVVDGGVTQADVGAGSVISGGARFAMAAAYRLNSINLASNGQIGTEDTSATIPTPDRMFIAQNFASTQQVNGTIKRLCYWRQPLPGSTLQAITG